MNLFRTLPDLREAAAVWLVDYNEVRPHSSLGYQTPAEFAATLSTFSTEYTAATTTLLLHNYYWPKDGAQTHLEAQAPRRELEIVHAESAKLRRDYEALVARAFGGKIGLSPAPG